MIQLLTLDIPLLPFLILAPLLILLSYILIYLWLKPYLLVKSYQNQGFITQFKPIVSTLPLESQNTLLRDEFYARMLDMCSLQTRPLGLVRNIGRSCAVMLFDPQMIKEMFMDKVGFVKHPFQHDIMKALSFYALTMLEGGEWKRHRKIISKGFDYDKIDQLIPVIMGCIEEKIEGMGDGVEIPSVMDFYKELAGSIMGLAYFGYDLNKKVIDGKPLTIYLSDTISLIGKLSYSPLFCATNLNFVKLGLLKSHREVMEKIKVLRRVIGEIVDECVGDEKMMAEGKFNMWGLFTSGNEGFTREEMVDEFITFFSDGVYTTGLFMTMFTYYMIQNPKYRHLLEQQITDNITNPSQPLTQKLLQSLPLLSNILKQTLRLAPPVVNGIQRTTTRDTKFSNGITIKKDTMIMACHLVNHVDSRYHENPFQFNPQRWNEDTKTSKMVKENPGCYIPFSVGERSCPGQKFAQIETALVVSMILSKFDVKLSDEKYKLQFTQRFLREPLNPIACKFTRKGATV